MRRNNTLLLSLAFLLFIIINRSTTTLASSSSPLTSTTTSTTTLGTVPPQHFCINENDNSFLNRCFREYPISFLTMVSNTLIQWVNPRMLAITAVCVHLLLPILLFSNVRLRDVKNSHLRRFVQLQMMTLNFLHRVCYTLVLDVALYAVFRQSRPCKCTDNGGLTFAHVGSLYGMPSGDAMSGAIFGMLVYDFAPFHPVLGRVIGMSIIPLICMERVILGYHTVAQVTVGSLLGVLLHIWNTRMPQWTIYFDAVVQFVAGVILLNVDPALVFGLNDMNNLFSWFIWGVGFQFYVCWCFAPIFFFHGKKNWRKLMWTMQATGGDFLKSKDEVQEMYDSVVSIKSVTPTDLLLNGEGRDDIVKVNSRELRMFGNVNWMLIGMVGLLLWNFLSSWVTQSAILVKRK